MKTAKYRVRRHVSQGLAGGWDEGKVVEVPENEEPPAGAVKVPDETPVSDWAREGEVG